jgi:thiol:disulfide interchange protein
VHFTGEGCLSCKVQWATFNKDALFSLSKDKNITLFEASLQEGADNAFILQTIEKYGLGGVPAYLYIDAKGTPHTLKPGLWDANPILDQLKALCA